MTTPLPSQVDRPAAARTRDRGSTRLISAAAAAALLTSCLAGMVAGPATAAASGELTQKPGLAGCISSFGSGPCTASSGSLFIADSVTISPDGRSAYLAAAGSDSVNVFDRAPDGTLTQKPGAAGCISDTGAAPCADGKSIDGVRAVTVSPDGRNVYAAARNSDSVAEFDRAADGTLTQKRGLTGCISDTGAGPCADGTALDEPNSVTVSPDGRNAYVASAASGAVTVLDRAADGTLTQKPGVAGCVSGAGTGLCTPGRALHGAASVAVSPDGSRVYVASAGSGAVAILDRNAAGALAQLRGVTGCISDTGAGPCINGTALNGALSITLSPDGTNAYVAAQASSALAVFDVTAGGQLVQKPGAGGCIAEFGETPCVDGKALNAASSVTVSPDGRHAYVASFGSSAVAAFDRAADGALTQKPGTTGCVSDMGDGPCVDGRALEHPRSVAISPDGASVYVASSDSDAVAVFDRSRSENAPCPPSICLIEDPFPPVDPTS